MDALSDVLKSVRLEGAVYLDAEFTAPWCIRGECGLPSVRARLAGAEHVAFFHFLTAAAEPGAGSMLAKLAELLFVEAMRRYMETLPPEGKGWLAGVRDAHVGRALALLHAEPARAWTVDRLAREAALSRSALAERFST